MADTYDKYRLVVNSLEAPGFLAAQHKFVRGLLQEKQKKILIKSLMIFGKSGLQGLPTRVALPLRDIQLRLSKGATGVPLFTTWDPVAGPGRTLMPGNNSGRVRAIEGSDGFWIRDYGGGIRVGRPFGAR